MSAQLNPYLNFLDNTREAMEFYQSVLGGELNLNTFEELGAAQDPADKDKIMHSQLVTEDGFVVMASDTPSSMEFQPPAGFAVSISGDDEEQLRGYWDGLSADGAVVMPFEKAVWGDTFGMCLDRYGVSWIVNVGGPESQG